MIGFQVTWDIYTELDEIGSAEFIKSTLNQIVNAVGITKVDESYKQFEPTGATGFILLEESHLSAHTWPEHQYVALDLFSCKPFDVAMLTTRIESLFEASSVETKVLERGKIKPKV